MVENHDCLCHVQKFFALCIAWLICINNNHYRIVIYQFHCLVPVNEHRWFIVRIIYISSHKRTYGCRWVIYNNVYRFAKCLTCTINTNSRAQSINICNLMPHNNNTFFSAHELFQRLCFDTGFDTGSLFHLLGLATIISNAVTVFDNNLISAASKCHFNGNT